MKARLSDLLKSGQAHAEEFGVIPQIHLSTPGFTNSNSKKTIPNSAPVKKWYELADKPSVQIQEVTKFVSLLNQHSIPIDLRMSLTEQARDAARLAVNTSYNERLQSNVFPVPQAQKGTLFASINLVEHLLTSYKNAFRQSLDAARQGKQESILDARFIGFSILEGINVLQRLQGCNHKALQQHYWSELNQVFHALWALRDIRSQYPLCGYLRNLKRPADNEVVYTGEQPKTPLQLFLGTQLFGLCDGFTWSASNLHLVDAYIAMLRNTKIVADLDPETSLEPGVIPIPYNQNRPADPKAKADASKPTLTIDMLEFAKIISADLLALKNNHPKKISFALATITPTDQRPMVEQIHRKLQAPNREEKRLPPKNKDAVRIYLGFRNCHYPTRDSENDIYRRYLKSRLLTEMLAETSASISFDEKSYEASKWHVINESSGGMLVQTQETPYTSEIFQGQLVAFQYLTKKAGNTPQLAYVNRIVQDNNDLISVALTRVARQAEAVFLRRTDSDPAQPASIGFLARYLDDSWVLILHSVFSVKIGEKLHMERGYKNQKIIISKAVFNQQEFVCYTIRKM